MPIDARKARGHEHDHSRRHESDFRIAARRNKLLGLWAASLMGRDGEAAEAYAKDVIAADLEEAGDDDVLRKVMGDFTAAKVEITREEVRSKMDALLEEARQQLEAG